MIGITSYGAYIPWHRMERKSAFNAWGGFVMPGEKSIAHFDEDSTTMAVEAALDCIRDIDPTSIDGLYISTTTAPYREKMTSATMAMALHLRRDIQSADVEGSPRAGTTALGFAIDAVKSGRASSVLVTASDTRMAPPAGTNDISLGDAAGALLVGNNNVIAEILGSYSISDELAITYRHENEKFIRTWDDRWGLDNGYSVVIPEVCAGALKKCGLSKENISKVVCDPSIDLRRHGAVLAKAGFKPEQIADVSGVYINLGLLGTAMPFVLLVSVLEKAQPGEKILFIGYGNGADAFVFQVTDNIKKLGERRGYSKHVASKHILPRYNDYLKWRDICPTDQARRADPGLNSLGAIWRQRKDILGLWGVKCRNCGLPEYDNGAASTTPVRVCAKCGKVDDFEDLDFSRKQGTIFTFTHDQLAPAADPPSTVVLIEFDGGGRYMFDMTDRIAEEVKVGTKVEMTFRKLLFDGRFINYYWKARPIRC